MSKFTIEKFKCDRCGLIMDEPFRAREGGKHAHQVHFTHNSNVGGSGSKWVDLCEPCNDHVAEVYKREAESAKEARSRTNLINAE